MDGLAASSHSPPRRATLGGPLWARRFHGANDRMATSRLLPNDVPSWPGATFTSPVGSPVTRLRSRCRVVIAGADVDGVVAVRINGVVPIEHRDVDRHRLFIAVDRTGGGT